MNDKIVNISFNVWANNEDEAKELHDAICRFIDWFGQRGIKVCANKMTQAINNWQNNAIVKNSIIRYFN